MGGLGTSTSSSATNSSTAPWAPAQPLMQGILSGLQNQLPNAPLNGVQSNTLDRMQGVGQYNNNGVNANAQDWTSIGNNDTFKNIDQLMKGGGALNYAPQVQAAINQYQGNTAPLANNTNYDPMQTPGIGDQLAALKDQITQQVNGSFAAGGRDGSGYNQKALGSGLTAGLAPILTNQYNQNVQNQQTAAQNLLQGSYGSAGLLSGMQQQDIANRLQGINSVPNAIASNNAAGNTELAAEAQRFGIPVNNLGLLANIGVPIAGLGSQSQSQTQGSQTASPLGQIGGLLGIGKMFMGML